MQKNSNYLNLSLSIGLGITLLVLSLGVQYYFGLEEEKYRGRYETNFNQLKNNKAEEVSSPIKRIFQDIGQSSNLVYNLSIFHTPPMEIIREVETAINLGRDEEGNFKLVTNENFAFTNYNTVRFGLISTDLKHYAELIKRLRVLYSNTFDVEGLQNFNIQRERDEDWVMTGRIFFTTDVTLRYLGGTNIEVTTDIFGDEIISGPNYSMNRLALDTFDRLVTELATKRQEAGETQLFFTSETEDNRIFVWTDIQYENDRNIYYISAQNPLVGILSLNNVGTEEDYEILRNQDIRLLYITQTDGSGYSLCTKVERDDLDELELQEQQVRQISLTELYSTGDPIDETLETLCNLL